MRNRLLPLLLLSLLLATSCASTRQDQIIRDADRLLSEGRAVEAARLYAEAVAKRPQSATLSYNHLYARYLAGEWEEAAAGAQAAFARFPYHLEFLRLKARALLKAGDEEQSRAVWNEIFALDPANHELKAQVMEDAYRGGQLTLAEDLAKELTRLPSHEKAALTILAALHPGSWWEAALAYLTYQD